MAHFPNPAAAGPILADEVVTIYANWTPFFRTIITDDELYCSQQEEPRVRPQHLPRDDRRRQKDVGCPEKANDGVNILDAHVRVWYVGAVTGQPHMAATISL